MATDTVGNAAKCKHQDYLTGYLRPSGTVFTVIINIKDLQRKALFRKINEQGGFAEPCRCAQCNPDTSSKMA